MKLSNFIVWKDEFKASTVWDSYLNSYQLQTLFAVLDSLENDPVEPAPAEPTSK